MEAVVIPPSPDARRRSVSTLAPVCHRLCSGRSRPRRRSSRVTTWAMQTLRQGRIDMLVALRTRLGERTLFSNLTQVSTGT
jgi:hypothetical protein